MDRRLAVLVLAAALTAAGHPPASAAPPAPEPPGDVVYFAEARSGEHLFDYSDRGAEATVLRHHRIAVTHVANFPNGEDGEEEGAEWFETRGRSRFFVSQCDAQGEVDLVRVSRKAFLDRVATTQERSVHIVYDAQRNRGTFEVRSGYLREVDGVLDLQRCP
jgi:hypothetical protein